MLSTDEIERLVALPATKLNAGRALFYAIREHAKIQHGETVASTSEMRDFARNVARNIAARAQAEEIYNHPGAAPSPSMRKDEPLSPVEMAWLERLPAPDKTSYTDAVTLAQLSRAIGRSSHPADARLVTSYWEPVREFHSRKAAEVALANANRPLPEVPASAHAAHAQATRRETAELNDSEASHRADDRLRSVRVARSVAHGDRLDAARDTIKRLDAEAADRMAVTRT